MICLGAAKLNHSAVYVSIKLVLELGLQEHSSLGKRDWPARIYVPINPRPCQCFATRLPE